MTDYKNLKLIASSSPHIRSNEDTRSIMLDVIIALLPALAWSVYCFGWKALLLTAVSVVSCVFFEWAYRKVMKKSCMVGDLSAVVTGILLSFVCPVDLPWWVIIIGAFFSINSHFTACSKQFLSSLLTSLTVLDDTNSFRLVLFNGLITARLFKRLW